MAKRAMRYSPPTVHCAGERTQSGSRSYDISVGKTADNYEIFLKIVPTIQVIKASVNQYYQLTKASENQ
jgi:hypothetical protein